MGLDLREIKRPGILHRVLFRHNLNMGCPRRVFPIFDRIKQVFLGRSGTVFDDFSCLVIRQTLDPLIGFKMPFKPKPVSLRIPKAKCVRAVSIHMPKAFGDTSFAKEDGDLL